MKVYFSHVLNTYEVCMQNCFFVGATVLMRSVGHDFISYAVCQRLKEMYEKILVLHKPQLIQFFVKL